MVTVAVDDAPSPPDTLFHFLDLFMKKESLSIITGHP